MPHTVPSIRNHDGCILLVISTLPSLSLKFLLRNRGQGCVQVILKAVGGGAAHQRHARLAEYIVGAQCDDVVYRGDNVHNRQLVCSHSF